MAAVKRLRLAFVMGTLAAIMTTFVAGMVVEASGFYLGIVRKTLIVNFDFDELWPVENTSGEREAWRAQEVCSRRPGTVRRMPLAQQTRGTLRKRFGTHNLLCETAEIVRREAASARVEFVAGDRLEDRVLIQGEVGAFLDQCPAPWGCLAVEYSRSGAVSRAWPFRPEEIANANVVSESDYPREQSLGWTLSHNVDWWGLSQWPNGDLLVVFTFQNTHPSYGGVARIAPDGQPRWYRKDYSHHWPYVIDENLALVPSMRLVSTSLPYRVGTGSGSRVLELECPRGIKVDQVNVIDGHGQILKEIPVLDLIIQSPYVGGLVEGQHCDPMHLNFAHVLGADAGGVADIAPGDLVVSLRNLSAFGILDKDGRRLKKLVFGGFQRQHGVRHLDKARFMMFDNLGTDGRHGPSRLLMVDLVSGEESTIFPNDDTPEHLRDFFAGQRGQFDISPDGRRVLLADWRASRAIEIRLLDGRVLNVFRQLHDVSGLPDFPEALTANAWLFELNGIHYANRWDRDEDVGS